VHALPSRIAEFLQSCLTTGNVHDSMVLGRTNLLMKDETNAPKVGDFRPIACLPTTFKLRIVAELVYAYLNQNGSLSVEQKGCRKGSRGTKYQLFIDMMVLKNCRRRHANLNILEWLKLMDIGISNASGYGGPFRSCRRFIFHSTCARQPHIRAHVEFYV